MPNELGGMSRISRFPRNELGWARLLTAVLRNEPTLSLRLAGFCEAVLRTAEKRGLIPGAHLLAGALRNELSAGALALFLKAYKRVESFVEGAFVGGPVAQEES